MKRLLALSFLSSTLFAEFPSSVGGQILYSIHQNKPEKAFSLYLDYAKESRTQDFSLLQQACQALLEKGAASEDPEIQLMCIFGAGVSTNPSLLSVLGKGIQSPDMKMQLAAVNFLSRFQDDEADLILYDALASPFLLTRLEAAYALAKKKDSKILECLQSLLPKVPPPVRAVFPIIVSELQSPYSNKMLRQFLSDTQTPVRCSAIIEAAEKGLDDLIPAIRALATHPDPTEQECCAIALGELKDEESIPLFQKWRQSKHTFVRLAALKGLQDLGDPLAKEELQKEARNKNLYVLSALEEDETTKTLLKGLLKDPDPTVRLNVAMRLLEMKEPLPFSTLKELIIKDERDIGFVRIASPSKGFSEWKIVPHATQKKKAYPTIESQTARIRFVALRLTLELDESIFLQTARFVFDHEQFDLVPLLVELLCNHKSPGAIALLKEQRQKAGKPFIRNYCNLGLYKIHAEGPYEECLISWIKGEQSNTLIQFREEEGSFDTSNHYVLTPEETSKLLVDSFEALAASQSQKGIEALAHAIAYGNPKNRYALAGLLMHTSE